MKIKTIGLLTVLSLGTAYSAMHSDAHINRILKDLHAKFRGSELEREGYIKSLSDRDLESCIARLTRNIEDTEDLFQRGMIASQKTRHDLARALNLNKEERDALKMEKSRR